MKYDIFLTLILSLTLTLVLESCYAKCNGISGRGLRLVLLVNVLTNPAVVLCHWVVRLYWPAGLVAVTVLLELAAAGTEGWLYRTRSDIPHPWRFAAGANLLSYLVGRLL